MAGALIGGSMGAVAPAAFASSSTSAGTMNGTMHCDPSSSTCLQGPPGSGAPAFNPVIVTDPVTSPIPPFVTVTNCPSFITDGSWELNFVSGNAVSHGTINKNGDWGGATAEGQAVLTTADGTVQYSGHLQEWGGGGQNSNPGGPPMNQSENGFTLNFKGSGVAGSISINVNMHTTTNNSGTPTSSPAGGNATCS
jgi:hypothetical protein